jgi:hypothetical protein
MIKPIVYHNIEDKNVLGKELMATIPDKKLASASKSLINIFSRRGRKNPVRRLATDNKTMISEACRLSKPPPGVYI